jgi:hypothetical protein
VFCPVCVLLCPARTPQSHAADLGSTGARVHRRLSCDDATDAVRAQAEWSCLHYYARFADSCCKERYALLRRPWDMGCRGLARIGPYTHARIAMHVTYICLCVCVCVYVCVCVSVCVCVRARAPQGVERIGRLQPAPYSLPSTPYTLHPDS